MPKCSGPTLALELTVSGIDAAYGAVRALQDVSVSVKDGETVALLGTNGNGKSTLMKCVMGIVRPTRGRILLSLDGREFDLTALSTEQIVNLGVAMVPEGRRLFPKLTVEENLLLGAFRPQARPDIAKNLALCYETFDVLRGIGLFDLVGTADTRTTRYRKPTRHASYLLVSHPEAVRALEIVRAPEVSDHRALALDLA